MVTKTVSIAMATYNGARFISEQLESLARQTVLPSELVVTDDNSTDNTLDIVAAFAAKAPFPVRVEKNAEQLGYRGNFMKAAGLCRSDFIAFCDQDDIWLPHKLENCLALFDIEDVLLVHHNATAVTETLRPIGTIEYRASPLTVNPPQSNDPWHLAMGFTIVFRRVLLSFDDLWPQSRDYHVFDKVESHDMWFSFLAASLGTIGYIKEPQALYRQHGSNTSGWKKHAGLKGKIYNLLATDTAGLKSRQLAAGARASILEQAEKKLTGVHKTRAVQGAAGYRELAARYRLRREMYTSGNIFYRSGRLTALLRKGAYSPRNQWGVGRKALLRDITCGVIPLEKWLNREEGTG